jgi:ribosome-binding factor A
MIRLNKIVHREMSSLLHTLFRESAQNISVTAAAVSPDLRDACVYFSVVGDGDAVARAEKFFLKNAKFLRRRLFQRVRIKYSPRLNFRYDDSIERGQRTIAILEKLGICDG